MPAPSRTVKAAFLDRDGTLVEEVNYLARPDQLRVIPGVPEALRALRADGYLLVLVTNQAGVARGYFTEADVVAVHERLQTLLGLRFDAIMVCPHHPEGVVPAYTRVCACRKPAPGMLLDAIARLGVDPARSFIVGDRDNDLATGRALGIPGYLVRTGYGATEPGPKWDDLGAVVRERLSR